MVWGLFELVKIGNLCSDGGTRAVTIPSYIQETVLSINAR